MGKIKQLVSEDLSDINDNGLALKAQDKYELEEFQKSLEGRLIEFSNDDLLEEMMRRQSQEPDTDDCWCCKKVNCICDEEFEKFREYELGRQDDINDNREENEN